MVLDHFLNNEIQEFLGKIRVEIGLFCKLGQPCDLCGFARRIGRWKVMFGLKHAHGLGVFKTLAQGIDKDRVKPVDAFAVFGQEGGGAGCVVCCGHMCGTLGAFGRG